MRNFYLKSVCALIVFMLGGAYVKAGTGPTSISGYHTYTSDGVTYYFTLDTVRYATLYTGKTTVDATAAKTTTVTYTDSNGTKHVTRVNKFMTGSPASTDTYYTDASSSYNFTISIDEIGASIYYATGWETSTVKDSNGRIKISLPDNVTVDGTSYPVNRLYCTGDDNSLSLGSNSSTTPFDLQLNSSLKVISMYALAGLDNLYEISFQSDDLSLYEISDQAFYDSPNCTINFNSDITTSHLFSIGQYAFYGSGVRRLKFTAPLVNVGAGAFSGDQLEYIDMSEISLTDNEKNSIILSRDATNISKLISDNSSKIIYTTYASIFAQMPEHIVIYLPTSITSESEVTVDSYGGYRNFVVKTSEGWKCHYFAVYDNSSTGRYDDYIPTAFLATDSASYNRSFAAGWNTIYLPYSTMVPSGVTVYTAASSLRGDTQSNNEYSYQFEQVSIDSLKPNTAYLLYSASAFTVSPRTESLTVPVTPDNNPLTTSGLTNSTVFIGTTEEIPYATAATYNAYGLSSDGTEWRKVGSNTSGFLGRYRAFIADNASSTSAKPNRVSIILFNADGTATAVKGITVNDLTEGDNRIYTVGGQYVGTDINTLPRGIYIKNGKKFYKQ